MRLYIAFLPSLHSQVKTNPRPSPPTSAADLAPFGSVGETVTANAKTKNPFNIGMERDFDTFVKSQPEGISDDGSTATIREAQRRARRRALSQRKLETTIDEKTRSTEVGICINQSITHATRFYRQAKPAFHKKVLDSGYFPPLFRHASSFNLANSCGCGPCISQ